MVPEISDRIVEIDRAMRWGYANALGPFEIWDALGFESTARRIEPEGRELPERMCMRMLGIRRKVVLSRRRCGRRSRAPNTSISSAAGYRELEPRPGITVLTDLKRARGVVKTNPGASLIDLGDGVLCCEFHSKANAIGDDIMQMVRAGLAELEDQFRRHGDRQSGREFLRRRESDDGAARRAGAGVGRTERRHPRLSADEHVAEVCAEAGGGRAVRTGARRRLRNPAALHADSGVGGVVYGAGRSRAWA